MTGLSYILPTGTPLTLFLIQLIIVVTLCRLLSFGIKYIKQPPVIAEVITGIILGPSVFGHIPGFTNAIFPATSMTVFNVIANVGLIIFMFMVGLEIDTNLMKRNATGALAISISAMVLPFLLGLGSAYAIYKNAVDASVKFDSFLLFVSVAMSITAFPVLARILTELKLLDTRVGNIALSSAAVDDVTAWCILALVVAIARAQDSLNALWTFLLLAAFFTFMMLVVRPLLNSIAKRRESSQRLSLHLIVVLLISMFACAWITEVIGVHAIFGSFILGVVVPRKNGFAASIIERIEDLVVVIFLPLYFTYSGLRTNIGTLNDATSWGLVILVITTACVGKITAATLATRLLKATWRESLTVGFLMNTKGLVELIVLNVGLDVKVLNTRVFTIFVIMALVTTFITTPVVHFLYIKHRERFQKDGKDTFSVFLGIQNITSAPWLVSVANIFTHNKENFLVKALLLTEISDRPSSYFFSEYYNMVQDVPVFGKKKKILLTDIKSNLHVPGAEIATKTIASADLAADVGAYCEKRSCSVLLWDMNYNVETVPIGKDGLKASFSSLASFDRKVEKVVKYDPKSRIVNAALNSSNCAVGVLVHKGGHTAHTAPVVTKVLFVYRNTAAETRALKTVIQMPKEISVSIVAKDNSYTKEEGTDRLQYIEAKDIEETVADEWKNGYNLIVAGCARGSNSVYESETLKATDIPVLVIYPETGRGSFTEADMFQMKATKEISSDDSISPKEVTLV